VHHRDDVAVDVAVAVTADRLQARILVYVVRDDDLIRVARVDQQTSMASIWSPALIIARTFLRNREN
jgi:hypothetical protein